MSWSLRLMLYGKESYIMDSIKSRSKAPIFVLQPFTHGEWLTWLSWKSSHDSNYISIMSKVSKNPYMKILPLELNVLSFILLSFRKNFRVRIFRNVSNVRIKFQHNSTRNSYYEPSPRHHERFSRREFSKLLTSFLIGGGILCMFWILFWMFWIFNFMSWTIRWFWTSFNMLHENFRKTSL